MGDSKDSRDKQARDAERRQRERELAAHLERGDEPEPAIDDGTLDTLESELASVSFPATGADIIAVGGDREFESATARYSVADLIPASAAETLDSPAAVSRRVQRPAVATAMKRVVEATDSHQGMSLSGSQRDAYEKTFRPLAAIDNVDDDRAVADLRDWLVERIHEKRPLPGSRDVRRHAANYCRRTATRCATTSGPASAGDSQCERDGPVHPKRCLRAPVGRSRCWPRGTVP